MDRIQAVPFKPNLFLLDKFIFWDQISIYFIDRIKSQSSPTIQMPISSLSDHELTGANVSE